MKTNSIISSLLLTALIACNQPANESGNNSTQEGTQKQNQNGVYFVNHKDGDTVASPVIIEMGVRGMTVEPAGKLSEGKGHHHLIIDGSFVEKGQMVPKDETHLHFGKGQTTDTLKLSPGPHLLTLQFGDGMHQSYGQDWSQSLAIIVKK